MQAYKISEESSPFTDIKFKEQINTDILCKMLYLPDVLQTIKIVDKKGQEWTHENERKYMECIFKEVFHIKDNTKITPSLIKEIYNNPKRQEYKTLDVKYIFNKHNSLGRVYPANSLGMCCFRRQIRHTIAKNKYLDIDMVNAHPVILNEMTNKQFFNLNEYCNCRDRILEKLKEHYKDMTGIELSRDNLKEYFIICLLYGGSYKSWITLTPLIKDDEQDLTNSEYLGLYPPPPFHTVFKKEMDDIAKLIIDQNGDLYESIQERKKHNTEGSIVSIFCQEYERRLLECIFNTLVTLKVCKKNEVVLCFDGLMVLLNDKMKTEHNVNIILGKCEMAIYEKFNIKVQLKIKSFDECLNEDILVCYDIENMDDINESPDESNNDIIVTDDDSAGIKMLKLHPHFKTCNNKLYFYDDKTGVWNDEENDLHNLFSSYKKDLYIHIVSKDKDGKEIFLPSKKSSYGGTEKLWKQLKASLKSKTVNNNWITRVELSNSGYLLFKNGIYDAKRDLFQNTFNPDIVFFRKSELDYMENFNDKEYMNSIKQRIFLNSMGEDAGNYFLKEISCAIMGERRKRFIMCVGPSNSGKSIMIKALKCALGKDTVGNFNGSNLLVKNNINDEAQALRWAYLVRNCRLIFSSEIQTRDKIDGNMIKKLAAGDDELTARVHCGNETDFYPQFLSIMCLNDIQAISPYDDAVNTRVRVIEFVKTYADNPDVNNPFHLQADANISNEVMSVRFQQALMMLIIETYRKHKQSGIDFEPECVKRSKEDWIGENIDPLNFLYDHYTITNNEEDFVKCKDIEGFVQRSNNGLSYKKVCSEMRRYATLKNLKYVEIKQKKIFGRNTNVWCGLKKVVQDTVESLAGCELL